MAHQIQQIRHRFYPKLSVWRGNYQHGSWLLNFLALLDNLPSKTPQQDEAKAEAFTALWQAALPFIDDANFFSRRQSSNQQEREKWYEQIAQAHNIGFTAAPVSAFAHYVLNKRKGTMTYEEACHYLQSEEEAIFGQLQWQNDADVNKIRLYLERLHALRTRVSQMTELVAMDTKFEAADCTGGFAYIFAPRKLLQEFYDHYAYETDFCLRAD